MIRNAIIMAAGMSTRFVPLSLETPKALLRVQGEVLIERQIRQLREAGIEEIVVVVGYKKEQFEYLKEKFKVILIENPVYQVRNNHSTLYVARDYLKNTFICSGDNYFTENVFKEEYGKSYYASVYEEGKTGEWCMLHNETGKIQDVQIGGENAWIMKGHAFFNQEFSEKLVPYIENAYVDESYKDKFWEELFMEHIDEMEMYVHKYADGIIEEFDSLEELRQFDKTYCEETGSTIMKRICQQIGCKEKEIVEIRPVKNEGLVTGFSFKCRFLNYIYDAVEDTLQYLEV